MAILIGMDEAGYGPLLGPLVVSAAILELPESLLKADLWKVLSNAVGMQRKTLHGRLLITDSKKAYTRKMGPKHLKRTVLASLIAARKNPFPQTVKQLLHMLCPACVPRLDSYPWYSDLAEQSLTIEADIPIAAGLLSKVLQENRMSIRSLQSRCLDVDYYNKQVSAVKNKSRVLFTELCCLVAAIFQTYAKTGEAVHFLIDRQGGRINYQPQLLRMFPGMELSILKTGKQLSSYELLSSAGVMRLHFVTAADRNYLPVSLASMTSKLIRELLIMNLNAYFSNLCNTIKPTAGYWKDGQRYIAELSSQLTESQMHKRMLVRIR